MAPVTKLSLLRTFPDSFQSEVLEEEVTKTGKMFLKGILQKANTLNQNGRIYPKEVLEREIKNYQKFILENRALGECVPPGTEIFTRDGWKQIQDISEDEVIYTLNVNTNDIELQRITKKVVLPFEGELLRFKNKMSYDMTLTPSHKVLIWDRNDRPTSVTAEELYAAYETKDSRIAHSSLRRAGGNWKGSNIEKFTLLGKQYEVDLNLWAAFLGIYLAEGFSSGVKNVERKKDRCVGITQKDEVIQKRIEDLLLKLPFDFGVRVRSDGLTKDYITKNEVLHEHLFDLGCSYEKRVPDYVRLWPVEALSILLEWMLLGDGKHRKGIDGKLIVEYATTSPRLAEDVSDIMFKLGHGASICKYVCTEDRPSPQEGRMILAENTHPMYVIRQHTTRSLSLDMRFMKAEKIPYCGDVFCVSVPNKTWLMRSNGKVCWTHNCDHPDSSVVSLKNVSHIIREAYFEGDIVYGRLEVLDKVPSGKILRGLVESGVKIGISSRGVGSTAQEGDYQVVQDDFQLICFDVVSEPSTPAAFMLPEGKDYTITSSELKKVFTKSDRLNRIVNDILSFQKSV